MSRFGTSSLMNLKTKLGGSTGAELCQIPEERLVTASPFKLSQQTTVNDDHPATSSPSFRDHYITGVLPSLQHLELSPDRYNGSRRLISKSHSLRRISEEVDIAADDMMFDSHFSQGSCSTRLRGPQYYGSELGNTNFNEDDDDYELLLDERLARDGLYRGL